MSDLYIEARLQAIKDIASTSCSDIKDADNIAGFCDEIYSAIPKLDKIIEELEKLADESYKAYCIAFNSDDRAEYDAYTNAIEIVKAGVNNE